MAGSWSEQSKVDSYVERMGKLVPRQFGELEMLEAMPNEIGDLLDLGCGDGRLAKLVSDHHPELDTLVAVDTSEPMLELARANLNSHGAHVRADIRRHDLNETILSLGMFDAVVSGFAVHHLTNSRKQELFAEVSEILRPGGVFANLEVVQCATPKLHAEFYRRIGRNADDPEDVLVPVGPQLEWMRHAGLVDVDCQWRWRGFALLVGHKA